MGFRLNRLDELVFTAVSKPMLTEFDIHYRCESCVNGVAVPIVHCNRCYSKVHHSDMFVKVFPTDVTIFWRCWILKMNYEYWLRGWL